MRPILFAFAMFVGLFFASRTAADAALRVCNATNESVSVAIAALEPGTTGAQSESEGWFQIDAQTCTRVIDTNLNPATLYYLYAKTAKIVWAGGKGTRDAPFCTNFAGRFTYADRPSSLCTGAGQQMLWFINEPVTGSDSTVELDSP
jgi:uncharacterized membrane protein